MFIYIFFLVNMNRQVIAALKQAEVYLKILQTMSKFGKQ